MFYLDLPHALSILNYKKAVCLNTANLKYDV